MCLCVCVCVCVCVLVSKIESARNCELFQMLKCVVKFPTQISGQSGLTETELEDILSCDDDVLNDVYTYWTPPVRRLPPLLLVRLKADLGQYLGNWISESTLEHNHDEKERANIYVILFCYGCKKWVQYI